jgi:hypothetical protein
LREVLFNGSSPIPEKARKHPSARGKAENGLAKRLANLWRRANMKKEARAVRGQEVKWEIRD